MDQLIDGRHKTSKFESEDVLSNIPDIAITNVLDRLPLRDAVRTSVLSRNWRFKWTMLSQIVIDQSFLNSCKTEGQFSLVVSRILLHVRGAITKFVISLDYGYSDKMANDEDICHWIFFLSRKGITDLTLKFPHRFLTVKLPTHLFSCLELKHLKLHYCNFHPPPTFDGFPNLLSLKLHVGFQENSELVKLFTRCPLLEIFKLANTDDEDGKVNLVEIAKLENLKILSLRLYDLDDTNLFELVASFPKLQELHLDLRWVKLTDDVAKIRCSTGALPCLKSLKLSQINLNCGMGLSCVIEFVRNFPNLQTLKITGCSGRYGDESASSPKIDYSTMGPLQLRRVVFKYFDASENEVSLIKCLLAGSPFLERIVLHPLVLLSSDQKLAFATKLLNLHRASPVAEVNLFQF